ncbi:MAG TPA: hypothetical protein VHM00_17440 [Caldimonas sp.]|jgi:ElaB/YqjD/DUF883 family membrane-anchored ribosome-binding protein|nr:hypothetical protein [Caldimonas sp.]HEX2542852.1 hypothetical protein [Caldimonas sp.]
MEKSPEQAYTDLMRQLASPTGTQPDVLARTFLEVERMHSMGQIEDWQMQNAREAYARTTGSPIGDAAKRALDKAQDKLRFATGKVRDRTTAAVGSYTEKDPVRAMLIAAGVGAVLMGLVAMMARSGVRRVKRRID